MSRITTIDTFLSRSKAVHGDRFDYSEVEYVNATTKVKIICRDHGPFMQIPRNHINSKAICPKCALKKRSRSKRKTTQSKRMSLHHVSLPPDSVAIPLTKGDYAIIDKEDLNLVSSKTWHSSHGYAVASCDKTRMHRLIMGLTDTNLCVDHINHNKLDNRKSNLRVCTNAENVRYQRIWTKKKSSRYKGVTFDKFGNRWLASIGYEGVIYNLGSFKNEVDAAKAYDEAAKKYHKEFAYLNFREDNE